jgi:hypothetical protein
MPDGTEYLTGWAALIERPFNVVPFPPGDANDDGVADGADYTLWADHYMLPGPNTWGMGDFNGDDQVDGADYTIWADNYSPTGSPVPAPGTLALLLPGALVLLRRRVAGPKGAHAP